MKEEENNLSVSEGVLLGQALNLAVLMLHEKETCINLQETIISGNKVGTSPVGGGPAKTVNSLNTGGYTTSDDEILQYVFDRTLPLIKKARSVFRERYPKEELVAKPRSLGPYNKAPKPNPEPVVSIEANNSDGMEIDL